MLEKNILAYHYAQITGVTSVLTYAPRVIKTAQLPLVMLLADPLTPVDRGGMNTVKHRDIRAVLFVQQIGFGTETGGYDQTDPFFDRVEDYFEPRQTLALANGTTDLAHEYMNDDGETVTPYPTGGDKVGDFWTITFKHQFTIVKQVIYQSGA